MARPSSEPTHDSPRSHGDLDAVLHEVVAEARGHAPLGQVRAYMPEFADEGYERFGLAVIEMDGTEHAVGDVDVPFPIQSISKVFALVLAMQKAAEADGIRKELWTRVDREPSGTAFNSLAQLEFEDGIPRNPMINAGALVVDDVLIDHCDDPRRSMLELLSQVTGDDIGVNADVLADEGASASRNRAMANLMGSFDNLTHTVDEVLEVYVHQCAIEMTARQLARATLFLANDGVDPRTGQRIISAAQARRANAIMLTCGTYDNAGEFAYSVGLPCKSGIAGGIIATVPHRFGVCVWSPPLDETGNSLAGRVALAELSERLDLSVY